MRIRAAASGEGRFLSDLALRSKAHWGYSRDFIERCRGPLTVTEDFVRECAVFVLEHEHRIAGFYGMLREGPDAVLEFLYVEPDAIGQGCGRKLWQHAVERARLLEARHLLVDADPNAERFYLEMGAERIGEVASEVDPSRRLPLLRYPITAEKEDEDPGGPRGSRDDASLFRS